MTSHSTDCAECMAAMTPHRTSVLTFDEKKAAEAAFRGLPVDPTWSPSAQAIYSGIFAHTQGRNIVEEVALEAYASLA